MRYRINKSEIDPSDNDTLLNRLSSYLGLNKFYIYNMWLLLSTIKHYSYRSTIRTSLPLVSGPVFFMIGLIRRLRYPYDACSIILFLSGNLRSEPPPIYCRSRESSRERTITKFQSWRSSAALIFNYKNKNWLQFLFIVKAAVLKQQISKFYPQI